MVGLKNIDLFYLVVVKISELSKSSHEKNLFNKCNCLVQNIILIFIKRKYYTCYEKLNVWKEDLLILFEKIKVLIYKT